MKTHTKRFKNRRPAPFDDQVQQFTQQFFGSSATDRGRTAMHKAAMKRCCMALALLAFSCNFSEGFVAVGQSRPRARLTEGDTQRDMIRAASKVGAPSSPLSPQSRRRRGRGSGNQQEGRSVGGGVGSLRIDMGTNMPGVELVAGFLDSPMATILEQSARHHYPSAFIGGTVGVLGTLTAIKVCVCGGVSVSILVHHRCCGWWHVLFGSCSSCATCDVSCG